MDEEVKLRFILRTLQQGLQYLQALQNTIAVKRLGPYLTDHLNDTTVAGFPQSPNIDEIDEGISTDDPEERLHKRKALVLTQLSKDLTQIAVYIKQSRRNEGAMESTNSSVYQVMKTAEYYIESCLSNVNALLMNPTTENLAVTTISEPLRPEQTDILDDEVQRWSLDLIIVRDSAVVLENYKQLLGEL